MKRLKIIMVALCMVTLTSMVGCSSNTSNNTSTNTSNNTSTNTNNKPNTNIDDSNQSNNEGKDDTTETGKETEDDSNSNNNITKSPFQLFGENAPNGTLALIVNAPTKDQLASLKITNSIKLDENSEEMLLIPKDKDTEIEIWSLRYEDDMLRRDELKYMERRTDENYVLNISAIRPEGIPLYKIMIRTPESFNEYIIQYDGKDGTPAIEYITSTDLTSNDKFQYNEMGYMFTNFENDIIKFLGEPVERKEIPFFDDDTATELSYEGSNVKIDNVSKYVYSAIIDNDNIVHPRGVKIGDTMESVISKFPNINDATKYPSSDDDASRKYSILYGEYTHMKDFGIIEYKDDIPVLIAYSQEASQVVFELENGKVSKVSYGIPLT